MNKSINTDRRANVIGSIWMVVAMAAFAVEDSLLKLVSATLPVGQILIVFGVGGAIVFGVAAMLRQENLLNIDVVSKPMRVRVVFEIMGRLFYFLAIALTPLSSSTVILQATPLVVVAGAALFFGEKVGWRRWLAIGLGLMGVVIIIRPGTDSFSMLSILAVIGMLGFAGRDLASRAAPKSLSIAVLGFYGFLTVVVAGVLYSIWASSEFIWPDVSSAAYLACAVLVGVVAYAGLMTAMRTGEVSAVTPFRYTRLLFGIALGVLLFDEAFDLPMVIGCGLIVVSGLVILYRGKAVAS